MLVKKIRKSLQETKKVKSAHFLRRAPLLFVQQANARLAGAATRGPAAQGGLLSWLTGYALGSQGLASSWYWSFELDKIYQDVHLLSP
jgi:hypothetical protein